MSAVAAGLAPFLKPVSVTLIRQDVLPDLPAGEQAAFRIRRRTEAVRLASSPAPNPDKYRLDVTTRQNYRLKARFTRHPVSRGESITDHRFRRPKVFDFQGWITATPYIPWTSGSFGGAPIGNRLSEQQRKLEEMFERGEPIIMVSAIKDLPNMAIESLDFGRTAESGAALQVTIRLVELRIVQEVRAEKICATDACRLGIEKPSTATSTTG